MSVECTSDNDTSSVSTEDSVFATFNDFMACDAELEQESIASDPMFASLDQCLDCAALNSVRSPSTKRQRTGNVPSDMRPIVFVRFLTRKGGRNVPVTLKALVDSGAAGSLVSKAYTKKLGAKKQANGKTTWSTPSGTLTTNEVVNGQFTIPELQPNRPIKWRLHVAPHQMATYDMILGRDLLSFLKIDIKFSEQIIEWDHAVMPFKPIDATSMDAFHVAEPDTVQRASNRVKEITDAKYEAANLDEVCSEQTHLQYEQRHQLLEILRKHEILFDGTLGSWKDERVKLELKNDAEPYHARAYPIPRVHLDTLKLEVERLCKIGVLKKVNRSEWAAPTFIIPKKDGSVRFISDFRELNKRIRRKPYPIPHIQDMLLNLEGFQWATSLDLNMGYYHIELDPTSKALCTIVLPFGKFEYQRIPMGLCNSPDIFQEKMSNLMQGLDYVRTYIDDLLVLTKGTYEDHLAKLDKVLTRLKAVGLKVNCKKSFFARAELEYLGYWISREGIRPLPKKVEAILRIAEPKTRKELRGFIGIVNYYRDMWIRRSHVLAPLAALTSKATPWKWGPTESQAFQMAKKVIARATMLAYPDFNKPFEIHTDASHYQLGAVISQAGKPIAFYSRKLNPAQTRYTTTERELLSIVETLKEYRNILLGYHIEVFTDHKNLVYKNFNTERVMRWRLLLEEFGPTLTYVKGSSNVVADALSRLRLTDEDFSHDLNAFELAAMDPADFPKEYPLSLEEIEHRQDKDKVLQKLLKSTTNAYKKETRRFSDKTYELITNNGKIVLPKDLTIKCAEWYHTHLLHPGETRMELTIGQHYYWKGMRNTIQKVCRACNTCKVCKASTKKRGKLPPKQAEVIPWHSLCIDLIGPYTIGKGKDAITLHCLTMIDPATGWFEIAEIADKRADEIANKLELVWLTRYPWPTEVIMDRGKEFAKEVKAMLHDEYGCIRKLITTRNPQANAMIERAHQVIHNMIRSLKIRGAKDLNDYGWDGVLAAVRQAMRSTVHTTNRATPTQLVFGRDALLNVSFEADWQYLKERKQQRILHNNKRENKTRLPHTYSIGDKVMIRLNPNRKHGEDTYKGPYDVTAVNDNGTVTLTQVTNGGAVSQTWNIRQIEPCMD